MIHEYSLLIMSIYVLCIRLYGQCCIIGGSDYLNVQDLEVWNVSACATSMASWLYFSCCVVVPVVVEDRMFTLSNRNAC